MTDQEARGFPAMREDAIAQVRAIKGVGTKAEQVVDIVLALFDEEAVARHADRLLADTRIRAMDFRKGMSMDLAPAQELTALWVGAARGMLGDAPNYVEGVAEFPPPGADLTVGLAGQGERFVYRIERAGKITPHQARRNAEAALDRARVAGLIAVDLLLHVAGERSYDRAKLNQVAEDLAAALRKE